MANIQGKPFILRGVAANQHFPRDMGGWVVKLSPKEHLLGLFWKGFLGLNRGVDKTMAWALPPVPAVIF